MNMKTVFEGIINGEKFDTVQAYNARMIELMNAGTAIQASSSTKSLADNQANVNKPIDDDLSFYPYFDDNDPHYLDLLVTPDKNINMDARKEVTNYLQKCYNHIAHSLYDNGVEISMKKDYLNDIREIINTLKNDSKTNSDAIKAAEKDMMKAEAAYAEAKEKFKSSMVILESAKPIINDFIEYYQRVEAEALHAIAECKTCGCDSNTCTCGESANKDISNIATSINEITPQIVSDLADVFGKLFSGNPISNNDISNILSKYSNVK